MSAVEKFPILLSEAEEESSAVPPCFSDEGINVRTMVGLGMGNSAQLLQLWKMRKKIFCSVCQLYNMANVVSSSSTSTYDIPTSICSLLQNETPMPPKSSYSSTRLSKSLPSTSKNSKKNQYEITS